MHFVVDAKHVGEYKIEVTFENGEQRVVDLSAHLDGLIFEPLRDVAFFSSFRVDRDVDTIVWPNDADFSPDFLHEIGEVVGRPLSRQGARPPRGRLRSPVLRPAKSAGPAARSKRDKR